MLDTKTQNEIDRAIIRAMEIPAWRPAWPSPAELLEAERRSQTWSFAEGRPIDRQRIPVNG